MIQGVLALGRAVNLGYHASGFLRLCRRAVRKLARLTPIPAMTKAFTIIPLSHEYHNSLNTLERIRLGYPLCLELNQYKGVLDSCPFGPGLSKSLNWHLSFRQDWHQNGTAQSCCVILGFITQSKYLYEALREAYLPKFQVFLLLEPPFIPAGFALRILPSSLASWTHPWANSASAV